MYVHGGSSDTYLDVYRSEPLFVWHVNLEDNIKVAFVIWGLVLRHTLPPKDDAIARLNDLARRTANMDATPIQVGDENSREPQERF